MRRQQARLLTLALVPLAIWACGGETRSEERGSEQGLYVAALQALRDSIGVYDSVASIPVQAEPLKVMHDVPAPGTTPEHYVPGRLNALAAYVESAEGHSAGWALCPAPAEGCVGGRPSSFLALSRPEWDGNDRVTVWATYWRRFAPGAFLDWEISYYKVALNRDAEQWTAEPAVFIGAEP